MRGKPSVQITRIEHTRVPFDLVQIDLKGPIVPQSEEGFRFVLTVICVYTRYVFLAGLKTKTKREVAVALLDTFWQAGVFPRALQSDRGTEFLTLWLPRSWPSCRCATRSLRPTPRMSTPSWRGRISLWR